jgi:hypothetical protein
MYCMSFEQSQKEHFLLMGSLTYRVQGPILRSSHCSSDFDLIASKSGMPQCTAYDAMELRPQHVEETFTLMLNKPRMLSIATNTVTSTEQQDSGGLCKIAAGALRHGKQCTLLLIYSFHSEIRMSKKHVSCGT